MKKLGKLKKLMGVVLAMAMTVSSLPAREKVSADEGYTATFVVSGGSATIDVYYTQDYTAASETNVTTAVARNGDTYTINMTGLAIDGISGTPTMHYVGTMPHFDFPFPEE